MKKRCSGRIMTCTTREIAGTGPEGVFSSTWDTRMAGSADDRIVLPLLPSGTYDFKVIYMGKFVKHVTDYTDNEIIFPDDPGIKVVFIVDQMEGFAFKNGGDKEKIINISSVHDAFKVQSDGFVYGCSNLTHIGALDISKETTLSEWFRGLGTLPVVDGLLNWDTSNITDMSGIFRDTQFDDDLVNWDVSNVTDMSHMFENTPFDQDISGWNISNVTTMEDFLTGGGLSIVNYDLVLCAWSLLQLHTGVLVDFGSSMYSEVGCKADIINDYGWVFADGGVVTSMTWDTTKPGSATDRIALPLLSSGIHNFDVYYQGALLKTITTYTDNEVIFPDGAGVKEITIVGQLEGFAFKNTGDKDKIIRMDSFGSGFKVDSIEFMRGCTNLTSIGILDVSGVTTMNRWFHSCTALTYIAGIGSWDTSSVINMIVMFYNAAINPDVSAWDVSNVVRMTLMFHGSNLSTANYDLLLCGWSSRPIQPNVEFSAGSTKYTAPAKPCRDVFINAGWTITDSGQV